MPSSKEADRVLAALPRAWRDELAGSTIEPVHLGQGAASVFHVRAPGSDDRYLKVASGSATGDLNREIERTAWLGERGVRVPRVLRAHTTGRRAAALVSAMLGEAPHDCRRPAEAVILSLALAFAALHHLPAADCPYDETLEVRLARAQHDVLRGGIDPDDFEPRNRALTPDEVYRRLVSERPAVEDIVVVHGDATFDNMRIDREGRVGLIDCGNAGRADRYVDLCLIAGEIADHFGAERVAPFVQAYGLATWDAGKARYFSDLYELF